MTSKKTADFVPSSAKMGGQGLTSPAHGDVTGQREAGTKMGSKMSVRTIGAKSGGRSASSKR